MNNNDKPGVWFYFIHIASVVVLIWQIDMAVQAGIAASIRPKAPSPSKETPPQMQPAQPPCLPGQQCPPTAPTPRR